VKKRIKILKTILIVFISAVFALASGGFIVYNYFPSILEKFHQRRAFHNLGFSIRTVSVGEDVFEYAESGEGDTTLVFLHGFQGDKFSWIPYCRKLPKNSFRIILPDFSGHGGSSEHKDQKYDLYSMAENIKKFVDAKGLKNFHLIGTSMGGGVATVFAAKYPNKINTLTLINPVGVQPPLKSDLQVALDQGKNLLMPSNMDDLDLFFEVLIGEKCNLSEHFKQYYLDKLDKKRAFFENAFKQLVESHPIDNLISKISKPTLFIMSEKDRILHPSSFEVFYKGFPNARLLKIKNGTHVLIGKHLDVAVQALVSFVNSQSVR
jgi:abhydrolase domain-containing protein 6